ncbi:MAG: sigma-54-dependent transcriptional regulator [Planctomycetota bacterium]|jgi:DNA-binding NtrC family response regulator
MVPAADPLRVLVVDDEETFLEPLLTILRSEYDVRGASRVAEALRALGDFAPHVVILDIRLPDGDGLDCLRKMKKAQPDVEAIMVTGFGEVESAVAAMKLGACDYVQKPVEIEKLEEVLRRACQKVRGRADGPRTASEAPSDPAPDDPYRIVGASAAVERVLRVIRQICGTDLTVLVQGESGTGKELVARAIHRGSHRRDGPFVAVNCARSSGELIDSELFGHEKGAFTGAASLRRGVFELAHGGTLLLDEIGTMPLATQDKLLRVVEEQRFTRVGGERPVEVDVRLVFATNRDLETETEKGSFREDLYYRMKVVAISVPPLRSRREDIPVLVEHFLRKHGAAVDSPLRGFTPDAMGELESRAWRGNVRELENTVRMLMSLGGKSVLDVEDLEALAPSQSGPASLRIHGSAPAPERSRTGVDRRAVLAALDACDWNQSLASRRLGVHRNTLRNMMKRFGIRARRVAE